MPCGDGTPIRQRRQRGAMQPYAAHGERGGASSSPAGQRRRYFVQVLVQLGPLAIALGLAAVHDLRGAQPREDVMELQSRAADQQLERMRATPSNSMHLACNRVPPHDGAHSLRELSSVGDLPLTIDTPLVDLGRLRTQPQHQEESGNESATLA